MVNGPVYSPWEDEYSPLDDIDEREWLAMEEQEAREESENGDA